MVTGHPRLVEFADVLVGARLAVESLDYLEKLDAEMMPTATSTPLGFDPLTATVAHARWAVGTAVTAIDLCAAIIGRLYTTEYPKPDGKELDVGAAVKIASLQTTSPHAWAWLQDVYADPVYQLLWRARGGFVHRSVQHRGNATVVMPPGGDGQVVAFANRPDFLVPGPTPEWRSTTDLMRTARDVAGKYVGEFRGLVETQRV